MTKAAIARGEVVAVIGGSVPAAYLPSKPIEVEVKKSASALKNEKRKAAQKAKQQEANDQGPQHSVGDGYSEASAAMWLRGELTQAEMDFQYMVGDPAPQDAARFLIRTSSSLLGFLPKPSGQVKDEVVAAFEKAGWDVARGASVAGAPPPSGSKLCSLVNRLLTFFQQRLVDDVAAGSG